jgi:hypothetical protein
MITPPFTAAFDELLPTGRMRQKARYFIWPQRLSEDKLLGSVIGSLQSGKFLLSQLSSVNSWKTLKMEVSSNELLRNRPHTLWRSVEINDQPENPIICHDIIPNHVTITHSKHSIIQDSESPFLSSHLSK